MSEGTRALGAQLYVADPPAAYRVLAPLTVDCSVLVAALFREPELEVQALEVLQRCKLHAPQLLASEIANVALKKAAVVEEPAVRAALEGFETVDLTLHPVDIKGSFQLARRYALTAYDSAYLWLAGELKTPLATFDRKLAEAARQYLASLQS